MNIPLIDSARDLLVDRAESKIPIGKSVMDKMIRNTLLVSGIVVLTWIVLSVLSNTARKTNLYPTGFKDKVRQAVSFIHRNVKMYQANEKSNPTLANEYGLSAFYHLIALRNLVSDSDIESMADVDVNQLRSNVNFVRNKAMENMRGQPQQVSNYSNTPNQDPVQPIMQQMKTDLGLDQGSQQQQPFEYGYKQPIQQPIPYQNQQGLQQQQPQSPSLGGAWVEGQGFGAMATGLSRILKQS